MKKIKKITAMLAAVAAMVLLPQTNAFTAKAAEPVTYSLTYQDDKWYFQSSTSDEYRSLYYLSELIKDGDLVAVYNNNDSADTLDLGNVHLSNLTFLHDSKFTKVFAGGIDDCYVLAGASGTVNCNVTNAYVYDTVTFNFNNNVTNLYLYADDKIHSNLGVSGTVGHLLATSLPNHDPYRLHFNYYDFPKDSLRFIDGAFKPRTLGFKTPEEHEQQTSSSTETVTAPSNSVSNDYVDEYDDVPQTGQSYLYLWLLGASIICFSASIILKRTSAN